MRLGHPLVAFAAVGDEHAETGPGEVEAVDGLGGCGNFGHTSLHGSTSPALSLPLGKINALSGHLFWDVNRDEIDPARHASWLTQRVLEYGRWADWQILVAEYGKPRLAELATGLRSLSPKTLAFCFACFQLPKSAFRCSASMPSRNL